MNQPVDGRRERHRNRRPELLRSVADYVLEHGLAELSLRQLATGVGVSHRTLLYHFGSKELLFSEVQREVRARDQLNALGRPTPEGEELPSFASLLRATWEELSGSEHDNYWRFYFEVQGLALQNPERYSDMPATEVRDWIATMQSVIEREGVPGNQAAALATLMMAAFRGLELDLLATDERARVNAGFEALVAALELLQGDASAPKEGEGAKR